MSKRFITILLCFTILFFFGCGGGSTPKPRGYFRIDLPEKKYQELDSANYPYHFYYPVYGKLVQDNSRITEAFWVNVDFPNHKARIHISYKEVATRLDSLMEDSRALAYKHALKAEAITERFYSNPEKNVYGILYNMKGNTASSWQFYATDSVTHFLRGALYFAVNPNKDSLAPVIDFFGEDLVKILETLEWNENNK